MYKISEANSSFCVRQYVTYTKCILELISVSHVYGYSFKPEENHTPCENWINTFYICSYFAGSTDFQLQIAVNVSLCSNGDIKPKEHERRPLTKKMRGYVTKVAAAVKRPLPTSTLGVVLLCVLALLLITNRRDDCAQSKIAYVIKESPVGFPSASTRSEHSEDETARLFDFPVMQSLPSVHLYIHRAFLDLRFSHPVIRILALEHKDGSGHEFRCIFKLPDASHPSGFKTYNLEAKRFDIIQIAAQYDITLYLHWNHFSKWHHECNAHCNSKAEFYSL